jgi:hypothetical protein
MPFLEVAPPKRWVNIPANIYTTIFTDFLGTFLQMQSVLVHAFLLLTEWLLPSSSIL